MAWARALMAPTDMTCALEGESDTTVQRLGGEGSVSSASRWLVLPIENNEIRRGIATCSPRELPVGPAALDLIVSDWHTRAGQRLVSNSMAAGEGAFA